MKVSKKVVKDEWMLPGGVLHWSNQTPEVQVISDEAVGESRWSVQYELIIKKDDKYWSTVYSRGTGDVGERPWEYVDEVEFTEVEPYEVTVTKYRVKE